MASPVSPATTIHAAARRVSWRWRCYVFALAVVAVTGFAYAWWTHREPTLPAEIFQGVIYRCERLTQDAEGGGLMHWVRVDLGADGVELFTTPVDTQAAQSGYEYRTRWATAATKENHLAVAINGTLFSRPSPIPLPGQFARGAETVVAGGAINHIDPSSFVLWFDEHNRPHMEHTRPVRDEVIRQAKWAIGGNLLTIADGKISEFNHAGGLDRRTLIGVDPARGLLFLAVFESVSQHRAAAELVRLGATEGIALDGGSSSEMAIGAGAAGVRGGGLLSSWVPTANHFGVRARRLDESPDSTFSVATPNQHD